MRSQKQARAFTVIELIIVIAIIAILIALLLPAIQAARAAALKNSGRNNMMQLALALQNHNDTYKTFPPLYFCNIEGKKGQMNVIDATGQYSWIVRVIPFMEEDMLYKQIAQASSKFTTDATMIQVMDPQTPGQMISPGAIRLSALTAPNQNGGAAGTTNYVALSSTRQPLLTSYTGEIGANDQDAARWDDHPRQTRPRPEHGPHGRWHEQDGRAVRIARRGEVELVHAATNICLRVSARGQQAD